MNLIAGQWKDRVQSLEALKTLQPCVCRTLSQGRLPIEAVLCACEALSFRLNEDEHLPLLLALGMREEKARAELNEARRMLQRDYLRARLLHELVAMPGETVRFTPYGGGPEIAQRWEPLGVLLHIAAGNADALPVFSVIEGLLTGNINILKLPGGDDGLSPAMLYELIRLEPLLRDYIYVFDFPSEDTQAMRAMAQAANAIVVWGGDAAVCAARRLAQPNAKIIEWGHKISFAYVSGEAEAAALKNLALHICETEQLYCSACQGIYLDTEDMAKVRAFAERFFAILDEAARAREHTLDLPLRAQKALELYTEELEAVSSGKRVYRTQRCSVTACPDSRLEPSYMFRNCWVKPLPRARIIDELFPYKGYLQTAALLCAEPLRAELEGLLIRAGVVRVTSGRNMSQNYCQMPHDGEYALSRYMKRVSVEYE